MSLRSVSAFDDRTSLPVLRCLAVDIAREVEVEVVLLDLGHAHQARVAGHREARARALYELARELSGVLTLVQVLEISDKHIEASFHAKAVILLPDEHDALRASNAAEAASIPAIASNTIPSPRP